MRKFFTFLNPIVLAAVVFFSAQPLKAQMPATAAGYAFTAYQDTYFPLSGGTSVSLVSDDKTLTGIPIGFSFPFTTSTYTSVSVSSNGWISLSGATASGATNSSGNATTYGPVLMPLWDDLNGSPNGVPSYSTTGSAPNRVFTFEWRNWRWYWNSTGNNVISFQAKLYETGRIEFIYSQGPNAPTALASLSATIGIAKSGTDYLTLDQPTASPIASSGTFNIGINARPATGQVYAWDRPCNVTASISAVNITNSSATVSWGAIPLSLGYEYILTTSATPPSYYATGAIFTSNTTLNLSNLASGTTYHIYVRNKCASNFSPWTAYSFATLGCFTPTNLLIKFVSDSSASMLWSQMPASDYYQYALSFSNQVPPSGIVNTNSITQTFGGLMPNSKYYFFLRSRCFGVDSSGWKVDSFVTLINCYPPVVKVNELGTNTPYAYWDPVPTAFAYEYAVTTSTTPPAFGNTIYVPYTGIALPADGNNYYLHVRTQCNTQYTHSQWSSTTLREGITNVPDAMANNVKIYPNPTTETLFIEGLSEGEYKIRDIAGRKVMTGDVRGQKTTIRTANLSPGVYLLQFESAGINQVYRFTKD